MADREEKVRLESALLTKERSQLSSTVKEQLDMAIAETEQVCRGTLLQRCTIFLKMVEGSNCDVI